jgi:hypothetical protein
VKEQAERKRFALALPKAERSCLSALEQWEQEHVNEQFLINDTLLRQLIEQCQPCTSKTVGDRWISSCCLFLFEHCSFKMSTSSVGTTSIAQRRLSKSNSRKKSTRHMTKPTVQQEQISEARDEPNEDTFEFTHIENIKHFNGLARVRRYHVRHTIDM